MTYQIFAETVPASVPAEAGNSMQTAAAQVQNAAPVAADANTAGTTQPAAPSEPAAQQQPGMKDGLMGMLPFIILIVVMFYLMYRGQKKEQKRRQEMIDSVKKGDNVLTVGGIFGKVAEIHDDRFILEVAENVKVTVAKTAVSTVKAPGESLKKSDEGARK